MPKRTLKLITGGRRILLLAALLTLIAPVAEAQLVVFDDFDGDSIDAAKWTARQFITRDGGTGSLLEVRREVTPGEALVMRTRVVGGDAADSGSFSAENALAFRRPGALNEILFNVRVRSVTVAGCAAGSAAEAAARGVFALFNDGEGDVVAIVSVSRSSGSSALADQLDVTASLVHRSAEGNGLLGQVSLGTAMVGDRVRLRTRWERARNRVRFQRDGEALVTIDYTNAVVDNPGRPRKYLGAVATASDCSAGGSSADIDAVFNNVRVNP